MATLPADRSVQASARLYERLLALYPARYRAEYGPAMAQLFRDLAREAHGAGRGWGLARLWLRVLADTGRSAGEEHWQAFAESWRGACGVDLAWLRAGWPGLLLATLIIVGGMAAKVLVLRQTESVAAAAGVQVGALIVAALLLDRALRAGGQLLLASAVLIVSLFLPLAWTAERAAWLRANPFMAYTLVMLPFAWRQGRAPWRNLWAGTIVYALTNVAVGLLVGP